MSSSSNPCSDKQSILSDEELKRKTLQRLLDRDEEIHKKQLLDAAARLGAEKGRTLAAAAHNEAEKGRTADAETRKLEAQASIENGAAILEMAKILWGTSEMSLQETSASPDSTSRSDSSLETTTHA